MPVNPKAKLVENILDLKSLEQKPTRDGFGLVGIIIALAVVLLAGGGGLYYRNRQLTTDNSQQTADNKSAKEVEENQSSVNEVAVDTSDWKTYVNTHDGWQISFPAEYVYIPDDSKLAENTGNKIITISLRKLKIYSREWATREDPPSGVVFNIFVSEEKPPNMSLIEVAQAVINTSGYLYVGVSPEMVRVGGKEFVRVRREDASGPCPIEEVYLSEIYSNQTQTAKLFHIALEKCLPETMSRDEEIKQIIGTLRIN